MLASHDVGWWIGQSGEHVGLFLESDTEPCEVDASPRSGMSGALGSYWTNLQTFRTGQDEPMRSTAGYSNAMFIYPQRLLVNKNKNLALRVQLCDGADGRTSPISDRAFFSRYGDGSTGGGETDDMRSVSDSYLSCVHTRTKCCEFTDEVRVDLPLVQDVRQYLLFTVLHINMESGSKLTGCCASKPAGGGVQHGGVETVVGYASLPIYTTSSETPCLIEDGKPFLDLSIAGMFC